MNSNINILETAKVSIQHQSQSISQLVNYLTEDFTAAVEKIYQSKGRLVVTGIGKSALIGSKIVATLNSTGTPSLFLHAAEAMHGDLGIVQPGDVVLCISNSGNSPEIKVLAPLLKRYGNTLIGMTANPESFLGKTSDLIIQSYVKEEACPNNLAPMDSTTAQLVLGDALAVCLMELRNFKADDFALYHPGGALGKKLLLRVENMLDASKKPLVNPNSSIKDVIVEIGEKRLGVTAVVENGKIVGIITDGDIRRMLATRDDLQGVLAADIMSKNPKTITLKDMVVDAFNLMENNAITQLIVVDEANNYQGIIHIHDILKEGVI
ncbi:KpsF/GutQ family sugar-phosphate isomerase [Flavobacterium agricola]|uniref:KpsF/GutQ family sugar-phosphate isomerase n=1 Tax=Flavobacterium agricola TaxID=2870839 RepID=A0ABY6LW75_9FLAO|nr:KpsF/GutQ family sugar-phosphate isomerase [Flavobacterium agricola]UYW00491.1 KpsF/GutQ family sugar-phosphate isomerase [Flavobacterium agricola]